MPESDLQESLIRLAAQDRELLAHIEGVNREAARRSGPWLACGPGCTNCCLGPFAITQLDAWRLERGIEALERSAPARAEAVRRRAAGYVAQIAGDYPGDAQTGLLFDEDALPESMEDLPCPALDPGTGCCDLYEARPLTCRNFGPAARLPDGGIAVCELCYQGAADSDIARCAVDFDDQGRESALLAELAQTGRGGLTIVAFALITKSA